MTPGTTVPFLVPAGNSANATQWQSSTAGSGNYYEAQSGGTGTTSTGGAGGGSSTTVGTPTITYTLLTNQTGGNGGNGGGANTLGGGGGGGAGGTAANGGNGGTSTSTGGGGGGGGGAANAGGSPSTNTGGTGGNGTSGSGGGAGTNGTGSSGGGGGTGNATNSGGIGGSGTDFQGGAIAFGFGGGGGGSGGKTTTGTVTLTAGAGGNYGGGGGGIGCLRTSGGTLTIGHGGTGLIVIFYTSAVAWPAPESYYPQSPQMLRSKRAAGFMTGHVGSEQPLLNLRPFTEVQPPQPPFAMARSSRYAGFAVGDDGTEKPFVPPSATFVAGAPSAEKWARAGRIGEALKQRIGFLASSLAPWHETKFEMWRRPPRTQAAMGHRTGFLASSLAPWNETQFETWRRPPRRQSMIGDDGIENPFAIPTSAWGYEALSPAIRMMLRRLPMTGDDGIENPFAVPSSKWGFDALPSDLRKKAIRLPAIGEDGIENPFAPPLAAWGYEAPAITIRLRSSRDPARGDDGIENRFSAPLIPWGYDLQPLAARAKTTRDPQRGDDGNELPYAFWVNGGWEIAPPVTYNFTRRRFGAVVRGNDGDEGGLLNLGNFGFEVQSWQPPRIRFKNLDDGDRGTESPFAAVIAPWGYEPPSVAPRPRSKAVGVLRSDAVEFPRLSLAIYGWDSVLPSPPHRWFKNLDDGDGGIESPFSAATFPMTFDQIWQPRRPPRERSGVRFTSGFLGTSFLPTAWGYDFVAPDLRVRARTRAEAVRQRIGFLASSTPLTPYVFDQLPQPPRPLWNRWAGLLGRDEFMWYTYVPWVEAQTEPLRARRPEFSALAQRVDFASFTYVPWQEVNAEMWRPRPRPQGAFTRGEDPANPAAAVVFTPQFDQAWQPPHPRPERAGTLFGGDIGTESPFIVTVFKPYFDQDFHARLRRKPVPQQWAWNVDTSLLNLAIFTEVQSVQPPRRPWERRGAFLRGDDGTEGVLVPPLVPFGWFVQPWQPPHFAPERRFGALARGDDGTESPLPPVVPPFGWFIQPWQPPRRRWERWAGIAPRDDQAQFPLLNLRVFTEVQPPQPPHRPLPTVGAILKGDAGIDGRFIPFFPMGWEIQPPQPPYRPGPRVGTFLRGDDQAYYPQINLRPMGWEIQPPQPPHTPGPRVGAFLRGIDGIESGFAGPLSPYFFDQVETILRKPVLIPQLFLIPQEYAIFGTAALAVTIVTQWTGNSFVDTWAPATVVVSMGVSTKVQGER